MEKKKYGVQLALLIGILLIIVTVLIIIGFSSNKREEKKDDYQFSSMFQKLDLNISNADVTIETHTGSQIKVEVITYFNERVTVQDRGSELLIRQRSKNWLSFNFSRERPVIKIYIPENFTMDHDYHLSSGSLIVKGVNVNELDLELSSGNIRMNDITSLSTDIHVTSGNVNLQNVTTAQELDIEVTSGKVEYFGTANDLNLDLTSGNANVDLTNAPRELDIDITSGNASVSIPDNEGFTLNKRKTSGNINVGFELLEQNGSHVYKNGSNRYKIEVTSGTVNLNRK